MAPPVECVITVMGSTSVGKSALTIRFIENNFFEEYIPTVVKTYHRKVTNNGKDYLLKLFDTAGMEEHSLIHSQFTSSHGYVLVYSISDRQSFTTVKDIYEKLGDELNRSDIPIVIVGNKTDLDRQRVISFEEGKNLADTWHAGFLETSAKKGDKVTDVFLTLLNIIDPPTHVHTPHTQNGHAQNARGSKVETSQGVNNKAARTSIHSGETNSNKNCVIS